MWGLGQKGRVAKLIEGGAETHWEGTGNPRGRVDREKRGKCKTNLLEEPLPAERHRTFWGGYGTNMTRV